MDDVLEDAAYAEEMSRQNARTALGEIIETTETALSFHYPVAPAVARTLRCILDLATAELERLGAE